MCLYTSAHKTIQRVWARIWLRRYLNMFEFHNFRFKLTNTTAISKNTQAILFRLHPNHYCSSNSMTTFGFRKIKSIFSYIRISLSNNSVFLLIVIPCLWISQILDGKLLFVNIPNPRCFIVWGIQETKLTVMFHL